MTPAEIELVRASWRGADTAALVERLHALLFAAEPAVESLFLDEPASLRAKFEETLSAIVEGLDDPLEAGRRVRALGERHAGYGVLPRHYELVEEALIDALGETLGGGFDGATERAWRRAYRALAEVMIDAALDARPSPGGG